MDEIYVKQIKKICMQGDLLIADFVNSEKNQLKSIEYSNFPVTVTIVPMISRKG